VHVERRQDVPLDERQGVDDIGLRHGVELAVRAVSLQPRRPWRRTRSTGKVVVGKGKVGPGLATRVHRVLTSRVHLAETPFTYEHGRHI
jgi:hypothetical protein